MNITNKSKLLNMSAFGIPYCYLLNKLHETIKIVKPKRIVRSIGPTDDVSVILGLTIVLLCILLGVVSLGPIALSYYHGSGETTTSICGEKMSSEQAGNYVDEDQTIKPISC